jgi:hypothetical protein
MLELEIRERLADYLDDRISLGEFEEWFIPETWDVEHDGTDAARDLTLSVMRRLVKYSNGNMSESDLRRDLGTLSRTYWFQTAPKTRLSGSEASVIEQDVPAVSERSRVEESA